MSLYEKRPLVYDCFTFFNELDLLEIRLNVLNDVVDKFVLVESTKTFSGTDKPLYFNENKERFKKFEHKIIHVIVEDTPNMPKDKKGEYWTLEFFQRNTISRGLLNCKNNDVILISDLDEIPNPEQVTKYKNYPGIKVFKQLLFYYYLNNLDLKEPYWTNSSTRMLNFSEFVKNGSSPQKTKFLRGHLINNGGWHFSYLGGADKIAQKIKSFTHILQKQTLNEYVNLDKIKKRIERGESLYDKTGIKRFAGIKIDNSFPKYIIDNVDSKYKHLVCKVNLTFCDKLILFKNKIKNTLLAYTKNIFFKNHINIKNYEI